MKEREEEAGRVDFCFLFFFLEKRSLHRVEGKRKVTGRRSPGGT